MDFFLWGHLKELVYREEPRNQMETMARIMAAELTVSPQMLEEARRNLLLRCNLCIQENGGHFEHLLE